jgi:6-phosphogluconolactonase (cycloisomerase 2 family)
MSSSLQFLVGSEGSYVYTFSFNPSTKSLEQVTKSGNFTTPSWVEPSQNAALKGKVFYAASEEGGKILSLELQSDGTLTETGSAPTGGSPAHG